ncbi:MAG: hypothetical protein HY586_07330, partial [Candidatus Omnitrophica bacterium]|nr:hypothetical protein [Candidatus Omnitrophota bacterium]
ILSGVQKAFVRPGGLAQRLRDIRNAAAEHQKEILEGDPALGTESLLEQLSRSIPADNSLAGAQRNFHNAHQEALKLIQEYSKHAKGKKIDRQETARFYLDKLTQTSEETRRKRDRLKEEVILRALARDGEVPEAVLAEMPEALREEYARDSAAFRVREKLRHTSFKQQALSAVLAPGAINTQDPTEDKIIERTINILDLNAGQVIRRQSAAQTERELIELFSPIVPQAGHEALRSLAHDAALRRYPAGIFLDRLREVEKDREKLLQTEDPVQALQKIRENYHYPSTFQAMKDAQEEVIHLTSRSHPVVGRNAQKISEVRTQLSLAKRQGHFLGFVRYFFEKLSYGWSWPGILVGTTLFTLIFAFAAKIFYAYFAHWVLPYLSFNGEGANEQVLFQLGVQEISASQLNFGLMPLAVAGVLVSLYFLRDWIVKAFGREGLWRPFSARETALSYILLALITFVFIPSISLFSLFTWAVPLNLAVFALLFILAPGLLYVPILVIAILSLPVRILKDILHIFSGNWKRTFPGIALAGFLFIGGHAMESYVQAKKQEESDREARVQVELVKELSVKRQREEVGQDIRTAADQWTRDITAEIGSTLVTDRKRLETMRDHLHRLIGELGKEKERQKNQASRAGKKAAQLEEKLYNLEKNINQLEGRIERKEAAQKRLAKERQSFEEETRELAQADFAARLRAQIPRYIAAHEVRPEASELLRLSPEFVDTFAGGLIRNYEKIEAQEAIKAPEARANEEVILEKAIQATLKSAELMGAARYTALQILGSITKEIKIKRAPKAEEAASPAVGAPKEEAKPEEAKPEDKKKAPARGTRIGQVLEEEVIESGPWPHGIPVRSYEEALERFGGIACPPETEAAGQPVTFENLTFARQLELRAWQMRIAENARQSAQYQKIAREAGELPQVDLFLGVGFRYGAGPGVQFSYYIWDPRRSVVEEISVTEEAMYDSRIGQRALDVARAAMQDRVDYSRAKRREAQLEAQLETRKNISDEQARRTQALIEERAAERDFNEETERLERELER